MRDQIQSEIESIEGVMPTEPRQRHCYQKSLDHLIEAKMWYGFEIAEIREKELARNVVKEIPPELAQHPATIEEAVAGAKFDGNTATDYVTSEKISANENQNRKKDQQGTPKKKG